MSQTNSRGVVLGKLIGDGSNGVDVNTFYSQQRVNSALLDIAGSESAYVFDFAASSGRLVLVQMNLFRREYACWNVTDIHITPLTWTGTSGQRKLYPYADEYDHCIFTPNANVSSIVNAAGDWFDTFSDNDRKSIIALSSELEYWTPTSEPE